MNGELTTKCAEIMGKIYVINDKTKVRKIGDIIEVQDFIEEYLDSIVEDSSLKAWLCRTWLCRIPIPAAVDYIANEWGITYKFV